MTCEEIIAQIKTCAATTTVAEKMKAAAEKAGK